MTYSVDFREKVVAFVRHGGGQREAARRFDISLWCVRDGLARTVLPPQPKGVPRRRKLDKAALRAQVRDYADALRRERAVHFGVYPNAIGVALKSMKLTRKKRRSHTRSAIWGFLPIAPKRFNPTLSNKLASWSYFLYQSPPKRMAAYR